MNTTRRCLSSLIALVLTISVPPHALGQCGTGIAARVGGETSGVARVNSSALLVARGTELELFSLSNPSAPAQFSPPRKIALDAPALKVDMTQGSPRAFVLLANGSVQVVTVSYLPLLGVSSPSTINISNAVDILADGQRVYVARTTEDHNEPYVSSRISIYDLTTGTPTLVTSLDPLTSQYAYDRLARVGNVLWAGFHEFESSIFGIDGFDLSNPSAPPRTAAALANAPLGTWTSVSAMTAIGTRLLVSYFHGSPQAEDWMRGADVTVPTAPTWAATSADLNGYAGCMSPVPGTNQLRITIKNSGIGTWDTTNLNSLAWLGAYFDSFPNVGQMVSGNGTDYWAAGRAGLMTMNTTNPASVTVRAQVQPVPINTTVVRQSGNMTVVLDYALNTLRIYDFTQPEALQLRGSYFLPLYSELLELAVIPSGVFACIATQGNPSGNTITILDINNPAAISVRATITGFMAYRMTAYGSKLYAWTTNSDLKVIDLTNPSSPAVSTTHYGVTYYTVSAMTAWTNVLALAIDQLGVWLINTTNPASPLVSGIWNPLANYHVTSMARGVNYLYLSSYTQSTPYDRATRLESVNVNDIVHPVQRFVVDATHGAGLQPQFGSLTYVGTAAAKFLVGVRDNYDAYQPGLDVTNQLVIYELPPGGFTQEGVPFPIARQSIPFGFGGVAPAVSGTRLVVAAQHAGLYEVITPAQWAPGFGLENFSQYACFSTTQATFVALPSANPNTITYQWFRDNVPLVDGPTPWGSTITGSTTIGITITNPRRDDARVGTFGYHYYRLDATNSCGTTSSAWATLQYCPADVNCDSRVLPDDVAGFVSLWLSSLGDGSLGGDFDGNQRVEPADVSLFVATWFDAVQHGC